MTRSLKTSFAISSIAATSDSRETRSLVQRRDDGRRTSTRPDGDAPEDSLWVNCGTCGTPLLVRLRDVQTCRTIDCVDCSSRSRGALAKPFRTAEKE